MEEESIFIKNDRIRHEQDKYEEEQRYKERNTRYSNNENGRYIDYTINNRSIPTAERRDFEALDAFLRGNLQTALTRAQNLIINDNEAIVPTIYSKDVYSRIFEISPIFGFIKKYYGPGKMSFPVRDDSERPRGAVHAEDFEEVESKAPKFKSIILEGHLLSSHTAIGLKLVNNTNVNIVEEVFNLIAEDFRITQEKAILQGDEGIKGLSTLTNVIETAANDAITSDDLVRLKNKIYSRYRTKNCCWVMHPDTLSNIELLKDGVGRYLWNEPVSGISKVFATNLFGYPVYTSENMPAPEAGKVAIYFGDFSQIYCKFSENVSIQVLKEKYATQHAIGIIGFEEFDAKLIDNNSQGIAALKFAAE